MTFQVRRFLVTGVVASQLLGCATHGRGSDRNEDDCKWVFARYEPSDWEQQWNQGEQSGERRDRECELLATPAEVERSVRLIRAVQGAVLKSEPIPPDSIGLFSRMVYTQRCGKTSKATGRTRSQLIEPLVGILRDPLTMCPRPPGIPDDVFNTFEKGEDAIQAKRQFLIGPAAAWSDTPNNLASWHLGGFGPWERKGNRQAESPRARQNIVMDLGASVYDGWHGVTGAVGAWWIVDRSKRHDVAYDWIVSFEYEKVDPNVVYAGVPDELLPHYIYFNQGVEKTAGAKWNPWRILQGMGTSQNDYVVVKLDIDNSEIESELVDQIRNTPALQGLIDEMFFEHHVNTKPMWPWWGTANSPILLKDTYRIFTELRTKGIRMHSWP